jgi:hypothetical protein
MPNISVTVQIRDPETNVTRQYVISITNNQVAIAEMTDTQMVELVTGVVDELLGTTPTPGEGE